GGAHGFIQLLFLKTSTAVPEPIWCTRWRREWPARSPYPNRSGSRPTAFLPPVPPVRVYLANPGVRPFARRSVPPDQYPFRYLQRANEIVSGRTGIPLRSASPLRAGGRCATTRRQYGKLRPGRAEGDLWISLPPAHSTLGNSRRVDRQRALCRTW